MTQQQTQPQSPGAPKGPSDLITEQESTHLTANKFNKPPGDINLSTLKQCKKEADKVIQILKVRINYLKAKEVEATKKEEGTRRRSLELDKVRRKSVQLKEKHGEVRRREEMEIQRKQEYNQEMKASMDYNKALVSAIYNAKREREVSRMKSINKQLQNTSRCYYDNFNQQQQDKVRRLKEERSMMGQKMEMYLTNKVVEMKGIKESRLGLELRLKRMNLSRIEQLREKEGSLQRMVQFSERYREQCEQEYFSSREKNQQFHLSRVQKKRSVSQSHSCYDDSDSNLFVS